MVGWERTSQLALGFTLGLLSSLIVSTRAESLVVFSGDSSSYAELKNQAISTTDGNFAASIWVWPTTEARGEEQAILAVSSDHHSSIVIGWSNSTFYYDDAIKAEPLKAKEEYPEQQWHQLTLTYETVDLGEYYYHGGAAKPVHKRMTLYVNGKPVVVTTTKLPDLSQVDVLVAAQWLRGSVRNHFEGGVDELRFYTRSLGERDATGLPFVKANIASQPIAWYYNFEDSPGSPTISSASNMMVDGSNTALVNPKLKIYDALRDSIARMPYDAVSVTAHTMTPRVFDSDLRTDNGAPRLPILGDVPFQADGSFTPSSFLGAAMCRTTEPKCDGHPGAVLDATTTTMKYNSPSVKNVSMSGTTYTLQVGNGGYNMANFTAIAEYNLALDFGYKLAAAFHFHASLMEQATGGDGLHKPDTVAKLEFGYDRDGQPGNALQLAPGRFARTQGRAWLGSRPEWTLCAWVKVQEPGILFYEQDRRLRHLANVLTVGARGQLYLDGHSLDAALHLGLWQFLCLQRSGGRVAAGVSGRMVAGKGMPTDADAANVTVSVLGHNATALLDDLYVWHRALPEAELQLAFKHTRSALEFRGTALRKEWLVKSSAAGLGFAAISSVQPASAAFSLELWVQPQDAVTRYDLLHLPFSSGTGRMLQLGMSGGYVYFEVRNDPTLSIAGQVRRVVTRNTVVQPKQWLHIVVTYSSAAIRMYTNGQPQDLYTYSSFSTACTTNGRTAGPNVPCPGASQGSTAGLTTPLQATQAAMIVGCDVTCSRPFQGKIASLRIWKTAVPAAKAASLYSCPPSYGDDALYAAFDLVEALGSKVLSSAKPRVYMEYQGAHLPLFVPTAASSLETDVGDFSWQKYTLAGDGTASGHSPRLGEGVQHVLQAADVCGHLITSGAQQVAFTLAPDGVVDGAVESKSGGDGTYTATYAIKQDAGYCGAAYQLLVGGPGGSNLSQHDMDVDAGPAVGHLSFVLKDTRGGQWNSLTKAQALVDNGFLLFLVDKYGCQRRTSGPDKVEVTLHGPGGYQYPGGVLPQSNGSYYLLYHPPTMGNFRVHVAVNGEPVGHAPAAMQTALEASAKQAYGPDVVVNNGGSPWCVSVHASKGAFLFAPPSYISTPSSAALNLPGIKWTISAWVWPAKQDDWPSGPGYGTGSIVSKMDSAKGYGLGMEKWKLVGSLVTSDGKKLKAKSAAAVEAETWTHVAMAYDGYELTLFVNAEEAGAASMSKNAAVMDTEAPLQVGGGFVGMIDEVKVMPGHRQGMLHYQQYCPGAAHDYLYLPFNEPPAEGRYSWDASGNFAAAQLGSTGGGPLPQYTAKQAPSKLGKLDLKHSVVDQPQMGYPNQPYDFSVALYDSCGMPYYSPVKQGVHVDFGLVKKQLTNEAHDIYEYPLELVEPVKVEVQKDWDTCLGVVAWHGHAKPDRCGPVRLEVRYGQVYGSLQSRGRIVSLNVTSPDQTRLVKKHTYGYPRLARTYVIQAYDDAGCPRTGGMDTFLVQAARLSASDSQEMAREDLYFKTVPVSSMGASGQYSFDFEPPSGGLYVLDISLVTPAGPVPIRDSGVVVDVSFPGWAMVDVKDQCDAGERYEPTVAVYDNWLYVLGGYDAEKQPALSVDPVTQATILGYKYRLAERAGFLFQRLLKLSHMVDEVVRVSIDTQSLVGAGKMKEDCSDLLLVDRDDPSTMIPYWIDPGQPCGSASTGLWLAGNATEYILMLYGNEKYQFKDHLDPAQALYLYDGFEQSAASPLSTGWEVSGCHMEQVDEASFKLQGELANGGAAALMIDAKNYTGGSLSKKLVRPVKTFYARAWFYDTDIEPASNFISPNYEDCRGLPGNKHLLPRGYGLGVHTNSAPAHYSSLYPFRRSWVPRTAGWHLAEFYGSEEAIDIKMDGQLVETIPTSKDSPGGAHRVFIRGGGPGCGPATGLSVWDDIVVGFWDPKLSVTVGEEEVRLHDVAKCQPIAPAGFLPHRLSSASVLVGDKLYMAGDFEDGAVYTFSFRYQVAVGAGEVEGKVEKIAPFGMHAPSPRKGFALVEFEGSLFVVGGEQSDPSAAMELWEFNMKDQGWKLHRPIHAADSWPGARSGLVAAVHGGRLVVYGGDTVDGPSRQTWLYDFRGQVWAEVQHSAAPMHRVDAAAAVSNSSVYVFGGTNYLSNSVYGDAWRFSFDTLLWSPVAFNSNADPGPRIKAGLATMTSYGDPALILYGGLGRQAYADLRILPIYDSTTAASH